VRKEIAKMTMAPRDQRARRTAYRDVVNRRIRTSGGTRRVYDVEAAPSGGGSTLFLSEEPMALSRNARELAAEISAHDWSDAPYRVDRAGRRRDNDSQARLAQIDVLTQGQTDAVRDNVTLVTAQFFVYADPNFDPVEYAVACGSKLSPGFVRAGLRKSIDGTYSEPGVL
jgi:hypothetical protein